MSSAMQSLTEAGLIFSRQTYAPGTVLAPHTHRLAYLSFVGSGAYREKVGRTVRDCKRSTLLYHPSGETHENFFYGAHVELLRIEASDTDLFGVINLEGLSRSQLSNHLCRRMLLEIRQADNLTPMVLHGMALELVADMARSSSIEVRTPHWLKRADAMLRDSLLNPPSLKEIATLADVHPVHLCRSYKQHFGRTIGERVRELRLQKACRLLASTKLSVAEIALMSGFCDQSHFARLMRSALGTTPTEYRRVHRR